MNATNHGPVELAHRVLGADKVGRDLNNAASWDAIDLVLENAPALAHAVIAAAELHEPACYHSEIAGAGERDAEFIAAARTTVPALLDLADAVLERHVKAQPIPAAYGTREGGDYCAACADDWPCPDYTAATTALERATDARA